MKFKTVVPTLLATLAVAGILSSAPVHAQYTNTYQVSLNTATLASERAANSGYQYQLDFTLIGNGQQTNTATTTLSNFYLGSGGSASGTPSTTGGASGNVNNRVTLNDSQFINEFVQTYVPGDQITFNLSLNARSFQNNPDELSFFILRNTGNGFTPIPTSDPSGANSLFTVDLLASGPSISTYSATNPIFGPATFTPTPAPPGLVVAGIGLLMQGIRMRRRRA